MFTHKTCGTHKRSSFTSAMSCTTCMYTHTHTHTHTHKCTRTDTHTRVRGPSAVSCTTCAHGHPQRRQTQVQRVGRTRRGVWARVWSGCGAYNVRQGLRRRFTHGDTRQRAAHVPRPAPLLTRPTPHAPLARDRPMSAAKRGARRHGGAQRGCKQGRDAHIRASASGMTRRALAPARQIVCSALAPMPQRVFAGQRAADRLFGARSHAAEGLCGPSPVTER